MTNAHRSPRRLLAAALLCGGLLTAAACGGDDPFAEESGESADAGSGGSVTVGGANFNEMLIMQNMYAELLREAGYDVDIVSPGNREIYAVSLESGEIDVVPEYAATMTEYLNREVNGSDAATVASSDIDATLEQLRSLAEQSGLVVLEPAEAADQNGFAVPQAFAEQNGLTTLSDLAALGTPVRLAAVEECPERPFCEPGLEQTYGLDISEVLPLGFGSTQAKQAVADGQADMVLVGTTDATLDDFGLVLLEDDKGLQQAENLVPVANDEWADDETFTEALNSLSDVLTTDDLIELNRQVDADRLQPDAVARDYLVEQGLIEG